jgi:hypothetical protein
MWAFAGWLEVCRSPVRLAGWLAGSRLLSLTQCTGHGWDAAAGGDYVIRTDRCDGALPCCGCMIMPVCDMSC